MSSNAFTRIQKSILAGNTLTVAQVDDFVAQDPEATAVFKALAGKPGSTVGDIAAATGWPIQFVNALVLARVTGGAVVGIDTAPSKSETLQ